MQKQPYTLWEMVSIIGGIGFQIAIPLVLFALLGRYVDTLFSTSPLFFLLGVLISLGISSVVIYRTVKKLYQNT